MDFKCIVCVVDEIWLKGRNRPLYFKAQKNHIHSVVHKSHGKEFTLRNDNQRFVLESEEPFSSDVIEHLRKIPGILSLLPTLKFERDYEKFPERLLKALEKREWGAISFRVSCKRADKKFPVKSMEVARKVGGFLAAHKEDWKIDLTKFDYDFNIKITRDYIYVSWQKIPGVGGLCLGMSGRVVTLLSGGFDSPVASYLLAKRGCDQTFVFFYAYPYVGDEVKEKIIHMASLLAHFQKGCELYIVPFGEIQQKIAKTCKEEYRTLLFRKYMVQTASLIAEKVGAEGLCTGDSLGQVSSQTMGNIALIDRSTLLPIFRPLVGHNKKEIIDISRTIGTHDTSVIPHDDACSLFAPKNPILRPYKRYWFSYDEKNDFSCEMAQAVEKAQIIDFDVLGNH